MALNLREPNPALQQERRWRWERNQRRRSAAVAGRAMTEEAESIRSFDNQLPSLNNESSGTSRLMFHPTQPYLLVADAEKTVSVWDYQAGRKVLALDNGNPAPSRISSLHFANEQAGDTPLLLVGSDDGAMRVWRGSFGDATEGEAQAPTLLTAWHALSGLVAGRAGPGMVSSWRQAEGLLLASGEVGTIRVWDMERELQRQDIATGACVTCLSDLPSVPAVVAAGRADGEVCLYDMRVSGGGKAVLSCAEHSEWVVDLFPQEQSSSLLMSGSGAGDVKLWDIRKASASSAPSSAGPSQPHPLLRVCPAG